jgi:hypothetical protein
MQEQDDLNCEQQDLERALRSMVPATVRLNPVSAAFVAGRASNGRQLRFWRAATAVMLLCGIAIRILPVGHGNTERPHGPGSIMIVQQPSGSSLPDESVLMLQRAINDRGAEGLPPPRLCPVQPLRAGDVL